eukprot:3458322-Amphidinium_carterae.1
MLHNSFWFQPSIDEGLTESNFKRIWSMQQVTSNGKGEPCEQHVTRVCYKHTSLLLRCGSNGKWSMSLMQSRAVAPRT